VRHPPRPIVGTTVDRRTALDRARDELTESLLKCGDPTTIATVIRFVDQIREITDRVLFSDYSAERFAFGRVATELDAASTRAGLRFLKRRWRSQFRIGFRRRTSGCSDNRITGIGTTGRMSFITQRANAGAAIPVRAMRASCGYQVMRGTPARDHVDTPMPR